MIIFLLYLLKILTFHPLIIITRNRYIDSVNIGLDHIQIEEQDVATVINKLDVFKSGGPSAIYVRLANESQYFFVHILTNIYNNSLSEGSLPT